MAHLSPREISWEGPAKTCPEVEKELNETGENYGALWVLRESDTVWCCRGFLSRVSSFHSHPSGGVERAESQGKG